MLTENFKIIQKEKIKLPTLELEHCNKFYDYLSEVNPISNYNFNDNKIKICTNKIQNLNNQKHNHEDKDKILYFESLFLKELSYFFDYNSKYANKCLNLNDKAKIAIRGCRFEIKHRLSDRNFSSGASEKFEDELIKRCAYLDYKYKFLNDLEFEASKTDDNINLIVKKYIDSNFY